MAGDYQDHRAVCKRGTGEGDIAGVGPCLFCSLCYAGVTQRLPSPDARTNTMAQKLFELANLAAGVIVLSQLVAQEGVGWGIGLIGLILFATLYILGYLLLSPRSKRPPPLRGCPRTKSLNINI